MRNKDTTHLSSKQVGGTQRLRGNSAVMGSNVQSAQQPHQQRARRDASDRVGTVPSCPWPFHACQGFSHLTVLSDLAYEALGEVQPPSWSPLPTRLAIAQGVVCAGGTSVTRRPRPEPSARHCCPGRLPHTL
jgi:hypothetical protein